MIPIGDLLSSKARTEVLRALCLLSEPVGIRRLARLIGMHPRSVEVALHSLSADGLAERLPVTGRSVGYRMRRDHLDSRRLREVFEADRRAELHTRTEELDRRAGVLCAFMDDGLALLARGRRSLHDAV